MHRVPALHLQSLEIVPGLLCQSPVQEYKIWFRLEWENANKRGQNSLSKIFGEIV